MRNLFLTSAIIFVITVMLYPGLRAPFGIPHPIAHIATFLALGMIALSLPKIPQAYTITGLISLAVFLEVGQFIVPSRTPEFADIACNLIGVALAYTVLKSTQLYETNRF